tara:strand:- start:183 stop:914 length:732 start_codon:yes stop_codon:yes gene_type:complete
MRLRSIVKKLVNFILKPAGYIVVPSKNIEDFYLHKYSSYEEYARVQIHWNKVKLNNIFADEGTLKRVRDILINEFGDVGKINGICHGTRNGFEQNFLRSLSENFDVIGTDISETATDFDNSIQWDFHDINPAWSRNQDFVYTNSLDQSWQPHVAVETWLSQLNENGILIIEHTHEHSSSGTSEMDPFGVKPTVMPYVLTMWFGSQISISHSVAKKSNADLDAWLFVIKKNKESVSLMKSDALP